MKRRRKKIFFTVTNDLVTDQRMQRICSSLTKASYEVVLIGRKLKKSKEISFPFSTKRIRCFFNSGFLFYAEYNLRLFFFLMTQSFDVICSIDLDTLYVGVWIKRLKKVILVYDAHEYFTESPEIVDRPVVKKFWSRLAKSSIPKVDAAYTVNQTIAELLKKEYDKDFKVIRNLPILKPLTLSQNNGYSFILYQGVLNKGRGLESLLEAMQFVNGKLKIAGDGDIKNDLMALVDRLLIHDKVDFLGALQPSDLVELTPQATIGFNLLEGNNKNYYYSLANKFFDYMMAGIPSIGMNFPEYKRINDAHNFAVLIDDLQPQKLANTINDLLTNKAKQETLKANAIAAQQTLNWQEESQQLVAFYESLFTA